MARRKNRILKYVKRHGKDADAPYLAGGVTIGVFSIVSIVLFGASWFQTMLLSGNNFAAVISAVLVDLANADRQDSGAGTLAVNDKLTAAAQAKANDMATKGYFSHNGPDGREPWVWIRDAGYDYQYAGENLAIQFSDSIAVERAWLASPSHRANLLNEQFSEIGIATAYGTYQGQPTTFVVQMFGTPRIAPQPASSGFDLDEAPVGTVTSYMKSPEVISTPDASESAVLGIAAAMGSDISSMSDVKGSDPAEASLLAHVAASPQSYLEYAYTILAAFILVVGGRIWWSEWRQRHFRHSAYAILLSIALLAFLYVADAFIFTKPVIADTLVSTIQYAT